MAKCTVQTLLNNAAGFTSLSSGEIDVLELQLLCEILNAGGGGGSQPFTTRVAQPIALNQFSHPFTNNTGRVMWFQATIQLVAGAGETPSQVILQDTNGPITLDIARLDNPNSPMAVYSDLSTVIQPGQTIQVVNANDPAAGNAFITNFGWF